MGSKVYFFDFGKMGDVLEGIGKLLDMASEGKINGCMKVAVKAHFGELGNYTHIRPAFIRRTVDYIKTAGGEPFATDTTTLYPEGGRLTVENSLKTAMYNGFSEVGLGCPLVIADEPDGYNAIIVSMKEFGAKRLKTVSVAKHIAEADAMVVVSHIKGHGMSGMGGALKNLGMGCTTKDSKSAQHALHGCEFLHDLCRGCGDCIEACHFGALRMQDGRPDKNEKCVYCLTCMWACENEAIGLLEGGKERFQEGLAEAAAGVMRAMSGKPVVFLNFIFDVTPQCDCAAPAGKLVVQNVGILASKDPVAIDRASIDLIDKSQIIPGWGVAPPDILGKINSTRSLGQLEAAERLGMGSMKYKLITI